jgi:hypothetical protein
MHIIYIYTYIHKYLHKYVHTCNIYRAAIAYLRTAVIDVLKEDEVPVRFWKEFLHHFFFRYDTKKKGEFMYIYMKMYICAYIYVYIEMYVYAFIYVCICRFGAML